MSSRYQLIAVSSLSILITLLVFWLLISKHILNRLISTINVLKQLAASNNEEATISKAGDELSDLAHTVSVFQTNAQKAEELQVEQLRVQEILNEQERQKLIAAEKIQEDRAEKHRLEQEVARQSQAAARAGDAGKGFAVVANEVKELANETASATDKIENRVLQIQTNTTLAVEAMLSISEIITKINDIQAGVVSAIDDQNGVTKEINDAVMTTSRGSKQIYSLIGAIAEKAEENKSLSSDISTSAKSLSNTAAGLQSYVNRYVKSAA